MREIKDFPGYFITRRGGVFSTKSHKFIKPWINNKGYHRIGLMKNNICLERFIHRLVAITYIPNPNNLPEVNHKDGNKFNNYYKNLEWTTHAENVTHAINVLNRQGGRDKRSITLTKGGNAYSFTSIKEAAVKLNLNYDSLRGRINKLKFEHCGYSILI